MRDFNDLPPEGIDFDSEGSKKNATDKRMVEAADFWLNRFAKKLEVQGVENLDLIRQALQDDPSSRFIISGSHFCDLDVPAAIKVFGNDLNLQISAESNLFARMTPEREIMMRAAGAQNFSPIRHRQAKDGDKQGVFDPADFEELARQIENKKTPWVAAHEFSANNQMAPVRIGAIYLAHKTDSLIVPTALEFKEKNIKLNSLKGLISAGTNKGEFVYHIGRPLDLEPIDVSIIEKVLLNRKKSIRPSPEERKAFFEAHQKLKSQAEKLALAIAKMLPPSQRGLYQ